MLLCFVGIFVYLFAVVNVLATQQVPRGAFDYLVGLQRWGLRLLAFQAGLVDAYPPFSFTERPSLSDLSAASAAE